VTARGLEQAKALGRTKWLSTETFFWRYYTSDLPRAVQTAHVVLQEAGRNAGDLQWEPRIREIAKGAKQDFPKTYSYEQACQARKDMEMEYTIPPLETEDEGWNRIYSFVQDLLTEVGSLEDSRDNEQGKRDDPYNVFVMAHSGLLRIFLRRLLGEERLASHPNARFHGDLFFIPNTSVTILDVYQKSGDISGQGDPSSPHHHDFDVDIVELIWAEHLGNLPEENEANGE
jgi:broad specificity phosphatase PhoE